jgi:hypothetical protein
MFTALRTITKIRFYPRPDMAARMTGGYFEGTQGAVDGQYVKLYTINSDPANNAWTEVTTLQNANLGFTAVRYHSPAGFGNVAEVEFYSGGIKLTGTPFGTAGTWNNSPADFTKVFDGDVTTYFDCSQADAYAGIVISGGATTRGPRPAALLHSSARMANVVFGKTAIRIPLQEITGKTMTVSLYDLRGNLICTADAENIDDARVKLSGGNSRIIRGEYLIQVRSGRQTVIQRIGIAE